MLSVIMLSLDKTIQTSSSNDDVACLSANDIHHFSNQNWKIRLNGYQIESKCISKVPIQIKYWYETVVISSKNSRL